MNGGKRGLQQGGGRVQLLGAEAEEWATPTPELNSR
jgi:hypothetical protein